MQAFNLEQSIIEGNNQVKELFEFVEKMAVEYDAGEAVVREIVNDAQRRNHDHARQLVVVMDGALHL